MDRTVVSAEKLNGEILEKLSCSICGYSPIFIECNLSVNNFSLSVDSKSLRIENLNLTDEFLSLTFSYTHKMIDFNQSIEEKVSDEWSVAHFFASAKEIINRIYSSKHSDQSDYLFLVKLVSSVDDLTFNLLTTLKSCSLEVIQSIKTFSEAESLMVCYNNDLAIIRRLLLKLNAYLIKIKSERLLGNNEPILLLNDTDTISHSIEIQKLITRSNVMYNFLDNLSNYLYSVLHSIRIALNLKKRLKNLIGNINKNIFVWDYLSTYSKHFFTQISDNLSSPSFAYLNYEAATISTDCLRSIKNLNEFKNWLFVTEHIDSLHLINKEVNSYQNTLDYYNYNKNTLLSIIDASSKIHEIYQRNNYDSSSLVELYEFRDKFDKLFVESSILCKMLAPNFISVSIDTVFNLNSQLFYLKAQESQWSCDYKYFGEWLQPVFNIFDELVHKISLDSFHNCDPTNDKKDLLSIKDKLKNIAIDIQTYVAIQDKALVVLHDNQRFSDLELILRKVITQIDSMVCSKVSKYQRLLDLIDLHYKLLVLKYSNNNIFFYTVTYNHENKQLTEETEWLSLVNSIPSIKVLAESCCRIIIPDISNCPYFEHLIPSDFFSDCNDQDISSEYSSWFNINFDFSQLSKLETFSIEATLMELSQLNILETSILVHQKNLSQLYEISLENLKLFPENINSECALDSLMEAFETCVISICFIQNLFGLNDNLNFLWTLLSSKLSNKFIVSNSSFDFGNVYKNIDKLVDGLKLTVLPISEQFSADFYNQYKTLAESIYPLDEIIDTNASELDSLQHFNEYHNLIVNEYHQEMLEDYTNSVIQIDQLTSYTTNYNEYVLSLLNSIETDLKVPANLLSNTSNDDIVKENSLKLQFEKISIELVNVCKFLIKSSDLDDHYVFMYIETINSFYQMLEELFDSLIKSPIEKEQIESTIEKDCKSSKIYSSEFQSIKDVHMELSSVDSLVLQNYVSSLNGLRLKEKILSDFDYVQTNIIEKRTATLLDNIDDKMEKFTLKKKILLVYHKNLFIIQSKINNFFANTFYNVLCHTNTESALVIINEEIMNFDNLLFEVNQLMNDVKSTSCLHLHESSIIISNCDKKINQINFIVKFLSGISYAKNDSHSKIIWNFQSSQYNPFSFLSLLKMLYSRNRRSFFTNRKWFSKVMTSFLYSNTTIKYNSYEHNSYIIKLVQSLSRIFDFIHLKNKLKFNFFNEKIKLEDFKSSYNYYSRQYLDYLFSESIYFIPQHLSNHFAKFKLIKCGFKWELFINLVDSVNSNHLYNQIPLKHQLNNLLNRFKDTSSYLYQDSILNNDDSVSMKILMESPLEKIISSYSSCMTAHPHQVTDNVFLNVINTFISTMELYSSLQPIPTSVQAMSIHYDHIDLVQNSFNQINESLHSYKIKILSNDSLYTTGCQTIKSTFLKIKDLRNSLHNDLVQLDDLVAALKNEFNKSGKIFFKLSLLINNLNQIDPNSFDILTSSNQLITFSIDGHEIYLKYIQYYEQIKNLYRKSMENLKILLQNSSTLIDWKLIILQWNQLKLDYFTITDNFSLFISNYTEIFDWIQSFQNVYQSLQASLLKYQKEESDDLSGHNHDDRYRYRRNDLRKKHWDLSFLRWITHKIQPKINLQSINLLNVAIDILSFKRYSLQLKLNNQFKKTFPSISEVHLLNLHHERLINFGKIVETTLKDFIESTERTHFNYYLSDCLIDSSICYLSSLEDDFNVYEKFFVIFSTAINKMEKDKKLNKLQAQNLLGKLNELKESVQNLLISMWNRLRIIKANIQISVQNFNITMNASYYLWNIYRNHTIFNMKSVNFQSYLLNCSHLLSYNQMFASSLDQLPEIPNSIDYSLSFNKIISVSNTLNRNINDKLNTQKALFDHQGLLSTKYQNISVELGEVYQWCTNNIKESIKFNFLTMGNQEIVNFRLLLIGIKVSILEYLNKLASVNTNLIEITFNNTRNLYDCDDLVKLYFQVKYQLNYALKSIEIVLFILEFSDQINSKVQLFKNNLEKLQRNFHSYLGSLRDFNGETFIQQSFNSFLVSIIEEHVNFLETFSEFKIYFNGSLYFNTKILDKMFYDYISLFKSIQMQLISLVVTWKKQKIHTINNPNDLMDEIMLKYVQTLVISSTVILKNSSIRHNYLHVILKYLLNLLESFKINFLIVNSLNLNTLNCLIQTVNSFYEFSNNSQLLTSNYILSNQNTLFNYYFNLFINGSYMQSLGQFDVFINENIQLIDSIDNYTNFIKTKRINQKGKSASLFKLPVKSLDMNGFISSKSAIYLNIEISLINFKEFINSISDFYRKLFEKNKNLTDWLLTVDQSIKEIKTQILSDSLECTTSCLNAINKLQLELFISPNHQSSLVDLSVGSFFSSLHLHNFKKMAYKHKYSNWKRSFKTSLSYPIGYQYNKLVRMNSKLLTMYENIESSNSINQNYLNNKSFKWAKFRNQAQQIVDRDLSRLVAYWRSNSTVDRKASLYEFYEILQSVKIKVNNLEVEQIFNWLNRDLLVDLDDFLDVIKRCVDVNVPSLKNLDDLPDNLKIESAIDRAIKSCTCETRFEIIKVNDCKYKFGSSFQIRLIRILSNTVMVRVGGGWEELMKFLSKVDPCRCGASSTLKLKPTFDKISTVQNTILNESMKAVDSVNSTTKGTPKKSSSLRPSVLLSHSFSQKNLSEADSAIKKTEYTTNTTPTSSKSVQSLNKDLGSVKMVTKTVGSASSTQKK